MPLIQCPDCEKSVSDKAQHCIHCGCPMQSHSSTSEAPVAATPYPSLELTSQHAVSPARPASQRCPKCGGTAFKKFSLIYEEQRSTGTAKSSTLGVGMSSGGAIGVGGASTSTNSVMLTDLARRVAPPVNSNDSILPLVFLISVGTGILMGLAAGLLWGAVIFLLIMVFVVSVVHAKYGNFGGPRETAAKSAYEAACEQWHKQFLCLQCGSSVMLDSNGNSQNKGYAG